MKPDLSPEMLRAFLYMQIKHAGNLAARFPPERWKDDASRTNAERAAKVEIAKEAGLSMKVVNQALRNQPIMKEHMRRLWRALKVDPSALDGGDK